MTKQDVLDHFGGVLATAKALGIKHPSVCEWKEVPMGRQYQIQLMTNGQLKAERMDSFTDA